MTANSSAVHPSHVAQKHVLCLSAFALSLAVNLPSAHGSRIYPEGKQVVLVGRVALTHGYGPPGFGEDPKHDTRVHYWTITLPRKVNVPCMSERPEFSATDCQATKTMRLLIDDEAPLVKKARSVSGKRASVKGSLHRADVAGEMTPIYMQVTDITTARRSEP